MRSRVHVQQAEHDTHDVTGGRQAPDGFLDDARHALERLVRSVLHLAHALAHQMVGDEVLLDARLIERVVDRALLAAAGRRCVVFRQQAERAEHHVVVVVVYRGAAVDLLQQARHHRLARRAALHAQHVRHLRQLADRVANVPAVVARYALDAVVAQVLDDRERDVVAVEGGQRVRHRLGRRLQLVGDELDQLLAGQLLVVWQRELHHGVRAHQLRTLDRAHSARRPANVLVY